MYKYSRGVELGTTWNKSSWWLEWDFNLETPDFKPGGTQATQLFVVALVVVVEKKKTSMQFAVATPFLYCLDSFLSNQ